MVRYKEYDNNFDKDSILDISIQVKFWRGIIFHHTAIPNGRNKIGVPKQRHYGKLVNRLHRLGWKYKEKGVWKIRSGWRYGMGYHFFIENDGGIYISRRWLEQIHGAHCPGIYLGESINKNFIGICVLGNMDKWMMLKVQYASLIKLTSILLGDVVEDSRMLFKHKDFRRTDCPGNLFPEIVDILNDIYLVSGK